MIAGIDLDDPDVIDVGDDHIVRIMYSDEAETEIASVVLLHRHKKDDEFICQGFAEIKKGEWEVIKRDPITLHPSFVCSDCGDHGIIREGVWYEADYDRFPQKPYEWLIGAIATFSEEKSDAVYTYYRPVEELDYLSPSDLAKAGKWQTLANWLSKQERLFEEQEKLREEKHMVRSS